MIKINRILFLYSDDTLQKMFENLIFTLGIFLSSYLDINFNITIVYAGWIVRDQCYELNWFCYYWILIPFGFWFIWELVIYFNKKKFWQICSCMELELLIASGFINWFEIDR